MEGFRAVSPAESPEPLIVHLRPNTPYLTILVIAIAAVAYGVTLAGLPGTVIAVAAGVMLVLFGYPVVLSTVCRVPVLIADEDGIRFPLMGPRLAWADVASVRRSVGGRVRAGSLPVLLVYPADAEAVAGQARPWLRREARGNLARYGTPIVVSGMSLDRSLDDIGAAIRRRISQNGAHGG
jgi:hypothetical protein